MNTIFKTFIAGAMAAFIAVGCATNSNLQSGGVYNGDAFLYNADQSVVTSYDVLDAFVSWEAANNNFVKTNLPDIFKASNLIRTYTPKAIADIAKARNLYTSYTGNTNATLAQVNAASNELSSAVIEIQDLTTNVSVINTNNVPSTNTIQTILSNTNSIN